MFELRLNSESFNSTFTLSEIGGKPIKELSTSKCHEHVVIPKKNSI